METGNCPACGHQHAGTNLASICVGCPCPERPRAEPKTGQARPVLPCPACGSYSVEHVCGSRLCGTCGGRARWLVAPAGEHDEAAYGLEAVCDTDLAGLVADSIRELQRVEVREIGNPPTACVCPLDDEGEPIAHVTACPRFEARADLDLIVARLAPRVRDRLATEPVPEPAQLVGWIATEVYDLRFTR